MTYRLRPLTRPDIERVRLWRNDPEARRGLRSPEPLTPERQLRWYEEVVCRPETSRYRYWAVERDAEGTRIDWIGPDRIESPRTEFVAQVSLESIRPCLSAEIGLITDPALRGQGIGRTALGLVLAEAFDSRGLQRVWGVCYRCNVAIEFWRKMLVEFGGERMADLDWTETTFADGREWASMRFWFNASTYRLLADDRKARAA